MEAAGLAAEHVQEAVGALTRAAVAAGAGAFLSREALEAAGLTADDARLAREFVFRLKQDVAEALKGHAHTGDGAADAISERHRFPQWLGLAQQWRGWALCRLGDVADGLALLEEGLRRMRGTGAVLHTTIGRCLLAEGCLLAGTAEAAFGHLEAAQSHAEAYGERYLAAEIHRLRAEARRAEGAPAARCEGHLREALALARSQSAKLLELRAARGLARLRRDQGRVAEARALLAPVYASFTEGFAFPDLVEARALLEDLGAAPADGADRRQERPGCPVARIASASPSPTAEGTRGSEAARGHRPCGGIF